MFCHYQEAKPAITDDEGNVTPAVLEAYLVIEVDKKGQMNGHFKENVAHHFPVDEFGAPTGAQGDFLFEDEDDPLVNDSAEDCIILNAALGN